MLDIRIIRGSRKKPKCGDEKVVNGVTYVRQFRRSSCGAIVVSGNRYLYEWVKKNTQPDR